MKKATAMKTAVKIDRAMRNVRNRAVRLDLPPSLTRLNMPAARLNTISSNSMTMMIFTMGMYVIRFDRSCILPFRRPLST